MATKYYPHLSSIIRIEQLPEQLNFLQSGLNSIFDNLGFRNFRISRSSSGDAVSYNLDIVCYKELKFDIPGTGFSLSLNPGGATGSTIIPVSLTSQFGIKRYRKNFKLETFSYTPEAFLELAFSIFNLTDKNLIILTSSKFITDPDPLNALATTLHDDYGMNITLPVNSDPEIAIDEIAAAANNTMGFNLKNSIIVEYIIDPSNINNSLKNVEKLFFIATGGDTIEKIKDLFIPKVSARLLLEPGIEFPREVLIPVDDTTHEPLPTGNTALLFAQSEFTFSTQGGIGFDTDIALTLTPQLSQIGNTGLLIGFTGAKLDLSKNTNIPEASADGRSDDFIGVFVQSAEILLPAKWFKEPDVPTPGPTIIGQNLLIGTGGISGKIGFDAAGTLTKKLGNFEIGLDQFDVTFQQNSIVEANIHGNIKINGFKDASGLNDVWIEVDAGIESNGDFHITATETGGVPVLKIPEVLTLNLSELSIGRQADRFYIEVAGSIDFAFEVAGFGDLLPKGVEIKRLRIWDDGALEFVGGVNLLPTTVKLDFGPVVMTITNLTLGSDERNGRKYAYFGFDGGVNVDPGGIDVRGNGVKLYFTVDGGTPDAFLRLEGLAIDITIPMGASKENATVLISGFLSMREPSAGNVNQPSAVEYMGGVSFTLPKAHLSGAAAMRLNPSIPAYFVDISIELPNAIPLGASGLGIYGFRGLIGHHYVVDKKAAGLPTEASWWEYYKKHVQPPNSNKEGIYSQKMEQGNGFALGAGVSLATSTDKGKAFSSKLFFMLALPDVFLLMGQAAILRNRVGLDTQSDPPFSALLAVSSSSIEANLGVNYNIPEDTGAILKLNGLFELGFFFGNASAWYLNIGRDLPEEKRVKGRLFTLFNLYSYLMLSSSGIRTGAGASWKIKKKFGPVKAELSAYADSAGKISFHPKQIGGYVALGGSLKIKVFKFKFGFSIAVALAGEAPNPFIVTGYIKLTINLPWPFKDIKLKFELTWTFSSSQDLSPQPLLDSASQIPTKAINMMSFESFPIYVMKDNTAFPSEAAVDAAKIPMDSFIDVEILRGVTAEAGVNSKINGFTGSGDYVMYVPPQKGKSERVRHEFRIMEVNIYSHTGSAWVPAYNVYDAATPMLNSTLFSNINTVNKNLIGCWQIEKSGRYNKIRIMGLTPWSYLQQSPGTVLEELGVTNYSIFCKDEPKPLTCIDFECGSGDVPEYLAGFIGIHVCWKVIHPGQVRTVNGVSFMITNKDAVVYPMPGWNFSKALTIASGSTLTVLLPEPCAIVNMKLGTMTNDITINYYNQIETGTDPYGFPIMTDNLIDSQNISQQQLGNETEFNIGTTGLSPVTKIEIIPGICEGELNEQFNCSENTPEANLLMNFLDTLASNHLFFSDFVIYPDNDGIFNGIFHNTLLYQNVTLQTKIFYTIIESDESHIKIIITDNGDYSCVIELQNLTSYPANWNNFEEFLNFQVYPGNNYIGENFEFLVDVKFSGELPISFHGKSCIPLTVCTAACSAYLYQICYQPFDDWQFNIDLQTHVPDPTLNAQSLLDALQNSIQPIWRPDCRYAIEIIGKDIVNNNSSDIQRYIIGFRTLGPVGHFHEYNDSYNSNAPGILQEYDDLEQADREGEYKLSKLKHYIDYQHSYPDPEGNIIMAKPLYYKNARLLLFFKYPYIYTMYNNFDSYNNLNAVQIKLDVMLKDPAEVISSGTPTVAPTVDPEWGVTNTNYFENPEVTVMNSFLVYGVPCVALSSTNTFTPISTHVTFPIPDTYLQPQKLYTALFNSKIKRQSEMEFREREVHKYVFQTSKYESFAQHIYSYKNEENGNITESVFVIERDFSTGGEIAEAIQVVNNNLNAEDDLVSLFNEKYDRLVDGALRLFEKVASPAPPAPLPMLPPLAPAVNTEFNIIKDSVTGKIIGILVRSPEPFNDPRMPKADSEEILSAAFLPNSVTLRIIKSKDMANAFITTDNVELPPGIINFIFKLKEWNGTEYEVMEEIDDIEIDLNI